MTHADSHPAPGPEIGPDPARRPLVAHLLRLARPHQWVKNGFVLIGPFYGGVFDSVWAIWVVIAAAGAFSLASSSCYVVNDIRDREHDRHHPRKSKRPIASGAVSPAQGWVWAGVLLVAGLVLAGLTGMGGTVGALEPASRAGLVSLSVVLYVLNVNLYTAFLKHEMILDVMSLSLGFVLRVLGGCAAAGVEPSGWLLNCTFFLSMFLAFGKRLGERRTMGEEGVASARAVQGEYTEALLRMMVVVTAVATLLTYCGYVQAQQEEQERFTWDFILLWLTVLPATYGLFRCIVLVEKGRYDDPTQLAVRDVPFQLAAAGFGMLTVGLMADFPAG